MQSLAKRDNVYLAQRRAARCSLLALTQLHLHLSSVSMSHGGHVMGCNYLLLLENTLWANLLGARGRCIAVGLPLLSQNFNCSVRLRLGLWITCYLLGAESVCGELPGSRGWSQCAVTRMTRGWPLARMTLTLCFLAQHSHRPSAHIIIILGMGKEVLARDSINFLSRSV